MGDLARYSLTGSEKFYKEFGVMAELLIDHAWGYEPVTMADIKNYRSENHSVSSGQVLHEPYDYESARLIAWEMADTLALDLFADGLVTDQVVLTVNYDKDYSGYDGPLHKDHYGRTVPKPAHGTLTLDTFTNSARVFAEKTVELFDKIVNPSLNVRAIYVVAGHAKIARDAVNQPRQGSLFVDYEKEAKRASREQKLQEAEVLIKKRYGRNAIMKLKNYEKGATMRARNNQVGGHKA
jgi:DNA polymerase V